MKNYKKTIGIILLPVILLGSAASCCFQVDTSEIACVTRFGKLEQVCMEPGLYFKSPVSKVNRIDRRLNVLETELQQLVSGDKIPFVAQAYLLWKVAPQQDAAEKFFRSLNGLPVNAENRLVKLMNSSVRSIFARSNHDSLISVEADKVKVKEMMEAVRVELNNKASENFGIEVVEVGLARLGLPKANAMKVYDTMKSERQKIAADWRARGRAEAAKIRSEADKKQSTILSQAEKDAQELMGDAEAKSVQIYAESFRQNPELYRFIRSLEAYKKILSKQTTIVLDTDSALLKYLTPDTLDFQPEDPKAFYEDVKKLDVK